jgi:hypothetical protein
VVVVLLLLPWVVALVQVARHQHLDAATIGILVAVSLGLPVLWVTWAAYRDAVRSGAEVSRLTIAEVADQLAVAVGAQWEAEAVIRRLNDPYPLPVSWAAADASLTDTWDSLVKVAGSGAGWPPPPPVGTWAAGPEGLAGAGGDLVKVLARVPTGRLVVLGEPGAGKTMLMVRLVLDLLTHRADGGPVPILGSIASWNPANQRLRDWLAAQLILDHPALADPPVGRDEPSQAAALLASGLILPILDGLDEIPEGVRGSAISQINDLVRPGERLVVTCRSQQYRDAVRPKDGVGAALRAMAAVQLRPLDADSVRSYLCDDASGPAAKARWDPVFAVLGTEKPAGQALRTPLMVGLARAIYNPRPGELAGALRDPVELCSPTLANQTAVEFLLFDAFIPATYRRDPVGRWKAQDAQKWLIFLARHLEYKIAGQDLAWWQIARAVPFFAALATRQLSDWLVFGGAVAVAIVPLFTVLAGVGTNVGLVFGVGVAFVAAAVVLGGSAGIPEPKLDISSATSPPAVLAQNRRAAIIAGVTAGLFFGAAVGVPAGILAGAEAGVLAGVGFGAVTGVLVSFRAAAWPSYVMARVWLALHRRLPGPLMDFLADAHRRGVLRQAGAVYQFRHLQLQHRLATLPSTQANVS